MTYFSSSLILGILLGESSLVFEMKDFWDFLSFLYWGFEFQSEARWLGYESFFLSLCYAYFAFSKLLAMK